jgi:hypothetical protein
LSTKGGLVWCKSRSSSISHGLSDTVTGRTKALRTNNFANQVTTNDSITSFNSNGFSLGNDLDTGWFNTNLANYVSWTFREQPKFFDIVTWTGNASNRTIAHSLGSVPGCIIVKRRDDDADWQVYHRSLANTEYLVPNTTAAKATGATRWNSTTPTSTVFSIGTDATVNASGGTYVAYLFAHDAGGFGLTGSDNVISCGSYTGAGASTTVTLGYEPQWLLIKRTDTTGPWHLQDVMRGATVTATDNGVLYANTSGAETQKGSHAFPTATGFAFTASEADINLSGGTYIYIAIRRGPMKVPTSGTSVFNPYTATLSAGTVVNAGLTPDLLIGKYRAGTDNPRWVDRLRGFANATGGTNPELYSNETTAESTSTAWSYNWNNTGYVIGNALNGLNSVIYSLKRAPSFFDEVCYTSAAHPMTVNHNLNAVPELIIIKPRNSTSYGWITTSAGLTDPDKQYVRLNLTDAQSTAGASNVIYNRTTTTFTLGAVLDLGAGETWVAYLFATCAGVSKVGSYTGTGATQTISCGFTGGARFVMIKRTDSTGDWFYWDTARGMVSGNDRYLLMNSNVGETNTNSIYTATGGFEIVSTAAGINASGGTYIFLAIA